jgi:WD40 repeat protein
MAVNTSYAAIRVRDTRTGRDLAVIDEADREARCAFSADGRYLAASGAGMSLSIWDIAAREELARMELPASARAIAFSPDSRDVAVLGIDGVLRRWPLHYTDLLAQACARLISNMAGSDWERFMLAEPYRPTCDKLPTAPEERR